MVYEGGGGLKKSKKLSTWFMNNPQLQSEDWAWLVVHSDKLQNKHKYVQQCSAGEAQPVRLWIGRGLAYNSVN